MVRGIIHVNKEKHHVFKIKLSGQLENSEHSIPLPYFLSHIGAAYKQMQAVG